MPRLIDTNILLRYVIRDTRHKAYVVCIDELSRGGVIPLYVFSELAFSFTSKFRRNTVYKYAMLKGEKEKFEEDPRCYTCTAQMLAGWRKEAAQEFSARINEALRTFPNLQFQYWDLVEVAINRMIDTGHDCVDCLLYAEHILGGHEVVSIDKHLSDISKVPAHAASKSIGKVDLR